MFKRSLILAITGIFSVTAFAGTQANQPQFQKLTITPGQGAQITLLIPTAPQPIQAPYALTGNSAAEQPLQLVQMQFGQGSPIWVLK